VPPLASNAQAMRAILLASATATTLNGLRARSCVSRGYFSGLPREFQHCTGSDHQNASQIAIALFRDRPEPQAAGAPLDIGVMPDQDSAILLI
jgi:hypothetical protein